MKSCGEKIIEWQKTEIVLRALTSKFDHIVVTIKNFKNLSEIKFEDLQVSLEAHEIRLKQRNSQKVIKQDLQENLLKKKKYDA